MIEIDPGPEGAVRVTGAEPTCLPGPDGTSVHLKVGRGGPLPGRKEAVRPSRPAGAGNSAHRRGVP